jgi:hypothetical protein
MLPISFVYSVGVVTQVKASETVCASGAVPPADGNTGCTSKLNTDPDAAVKTTANGVFGAVSAAVHNALHNDPPAGQSASISTANEP